MKVKKFTAATSRDALRKVREALGPDAVILSNRPVDGAVEILALDNDDVASLSAPVADSEMAQPKPQLQHFDELAPAPRAASPARRYQDAGPVQSAPVAPAFVAPVAPIAPAAPVLSEAASTYAERRAPAPEPTVDMAAMTAMMSAAITQAKESAASEVSGMMSEIRAMRGLMETQLAELSWGSTTQREPH